MYEVYQLKVICYNFVNYTYIIVDELSRDAMIVDPAWEFDKIVSRLDEVNANLVGILLTHSHFDHVNLVEPLINRFDADVFISLKEIEDYNFSCNNLKGIEDKAKIKLGSGSIIGIHTPGHTSGSTCYLASDSLFTGDTVFIEGCGICIGAGSSPEEMFYSIQKIKKEVPVDTRIYPGHSYRNSPGQKLRDVLKENIYFQLEKMEHFVSFRMRKNQTGLLSFK